MGCLTLCDKPWDIMQFQMLRVVALTSASPFTIWEEVW